MADEPHFDEHGRGKLTREFHKRCGFDPMKSAAGFAEFARAIDRAGANGHEWPEQFQEMLRAAVASLLGPMVEELVNERLVKVREAYAELKAEVERLKRIEKQTRPNGRQASLTGR